MPKFELEVELERSPLEITSRVVERALDLVGMDLLSKLIENSPVDHGRLQGSWSSPKRIGKHEREITSSAKYARFVNDGTGIYGPRGRLIRPITAQALRFEYKGRIVFARSVRGIKPRRFVQASMEQTKDRIEELLTMAIQGI